MLTRRMPALLLGFALVAVACGGGQASDEPVPPAEGRGLVAQVASYDLAVGETRLIVGLLTDNNEFVSGGTATMRLSFLGEGEPEFVAEAPAEFLALPGEDPGHEHPQAGPASEGRGVYAARVTFDRPGVWEVEVLVEVDGEMSSATAAFQVVDRHRVPAVGEEALPTENLTMDDADEVPPGAVDSRGETEGTIPDPELHETTIAASLAAGRPLVAVFATPVYCVSQFCGPITDMISELAADYSDRADFVHVEIWRDFQERVINKAAADWLLRDDNLNEPWVFFVDGEGIIRGRWDNVATRAEIEPFLRDLPPLEA